MSRNSHGQATDFWNHLHDGGWGQFVEESVHMHIVDSKNSGIGSQKDLPDFKSNLCNFLPYVLGQDTSLCWTSISSFITQRK